MLSPNRNHKAQKMIVIMDNDVFNAYGVWLEGLGIKRASSYKANLRAIENQLIAKVTNNSAFLQGLYDRVRNGETANVREIMNMLRYIAAAEQKADVHGVELAPGTYNDCRSALNRFVYFLQTNRGGQVQAFITTSPKLVSGIAWDGDPREQLNMSSRIKTQDRINRIADSVNFPIRIIVQIAGNASKWADGLGLPQDHPARRLKEEVDCFVNKIIEETIFLIDGNRQTRMANICKIGTREFAPGKRHVYVMLKDPESVHQVMTRKADGSIVPMVLAEGEGYSSIALDHVYRMQDLLDDFAGAFPFLKELSDLIRKLNAGDIRGAKTRKAVIDEIHGNFGNEYADKMQALADELRKLGRIISIEAIHTKDNLAKR